MTTVHEPATKPAVPADAEYAAPVAANERLMLPAGVVPFQLNWPYILGIGAYHIAADAKTAYVTAPGGNMGMDTRAELVWAVDIATHQVREITHLLPTSKRQRGIESMATRDGKLYLAVNAVEDWFSSAAEVQDRSQSIGQ